MGLATATARSATLAPIRRRTGRCPAASLHRRSRIDELPQGLLDRLRRAQPEARAAFFRRYAAQVHRILFLQGYCDEVDDAVQDVFVKVFRSELPDEEVFLGWFYRLILNTGRDAGRRRRTRRGLAEKLERVAPTVAQADEPTAVDPALRIALGELPAELREAVALRYFADLSLEQIAAAQDVPLGTVKSRLHTAVRRLRGSLVSSGYVDG
jgi:RNA polymerase sigma-70 factor (ECF subfamily)